MRITLITTSTQGGGAAEATLRLYQALQQAGVCVRLIALRGGNAPSETIDLIGRRWVGRTQGAMARLIERMLIYPEVYPQTQHLWRISTAPLGVDLSRHPWVVDADLIHLHWINHGLLSLRGLRQLATLGKPILWTLHDLWSLTGGCHLPVVLSRTSMELCRELLGGCGQCPLLGRGRSPRDLTYRGYRAKAFLRRPPFGYIAVSQSARALALWAHPDLPPPAVIAPPLPSSYLTTELRTAEPDAMTPLDLIISAARIDDPIKGLPLLVDAMHRLRTLAPEEIVPRLRLVLIGEIHRAEWLDQLPIATLAVGRVAPSELIAYYRQASLTLSTSLYETFGQTLTESLAVGTPVVAFDVGGPRDIIHSGHNGLLVPAYDTEAYAQAILAILLDRSGVSYTPEVCRQSVSHLAPEHIARAHIELYTAQSAHPGG